MDKTLLCNYQSMSCREEKIKIKNIRQVYKIYISQKDEMYKLFSDKPQPIDECVHKIESSYLILLCIGWVLPLTCTSSLVNIFTPFRRPSCGSRWLVIGLPGQEG